MLQPAQFARLARRFRAEICTLSNPPDLAVAYVRIFELEASL
jgi:hypothetical protein